MIEQRIKEANGRLKHNYCGLKIEQMGGRLFIRGTLPPKPLSAKNKPYQQRISAANANADGVKIAERLAKKISVQLDAKTFDWADYMELVINPAPSIGALISEFEKDYFQRRSKNFKSESTWKIEYASVFKFLDSSCQPNAEMFKNIILSTQPDTRTRKRFCQTLGALAKFAGIDFDPSPYAGSYSPKSRQARDLPTDRTIVEWYHKIKDSKWQWVYGILATYGLRNHEVFFLDLAELRDGNNILTVLQGKTGYRKIWPYHPEWFDQFGLQNVKIPHIDCDRPNSDIGGTVSQRFRRNEGIPFKVYDLRHCWAVRTLEYGIDISLAAQQMGHSLAVHSNLYHTWIQSQHHQRAFDLAISKSDRPKPPGI